MTIHIPISANQFDVVRPLVVPHVSQKLHYLWRYYAATIPSILRPHRLWLDDNLPCYQTSYRLSKQQMQQWFDLFGVTDKARQTPFTYVTTAGTLALMCILSDVGINFRHLLHLKNQTIFHDAAGLCQSDERLQLFVALGDVLPVRSDRVALLIDTQVADSNGRLLATYTDTFIILNVPEEDVTAVKNHPRFGLREAKNMMQRPKPTLPSPLSQTISVDIPDGAGIAYGRLSGDLNLVHTTKGAARLFGYPAPFVQGFYLINQVLKTFTEANGRPPQQFSIHFCRPAYTGQTVELVYGEAEFALCDQEGKMLAAGKCQMS